MFQKMMHTSVKDITAIAILATVAVAVFFIVLEPAISRSQSSTQFTVSTSVTAELSFATAAQNITMSSLPGITGGTTTGQTQVIVTTNNAAGYNMTLVSSSSPAMQGDSQGGSIPDYSPAVAGVPDYTFTTAANTAEFGYTVQASTTADLDQTFRNNGTVCNNNSGGDVADRCWLNASTTVETLINTSAPTPSSGSTSTLKFQLVINPNPAPAIPQDSYTATNTLTATLN